MAWAAIVVVVPAVVSGRLLSGMIGLLSSCHPPGSMSQDEVESSVWCAVPACGYPPCERPRAFAGGSLVACTATVAMIRVVNSSPVKRSGPSALRAVVTVRASMLSACRVASFLECPS